MTYKVIFTDTAKEDLRSIATYIAEQSKDKAIAIRLVNELREKTKQLESQGKDLQVAIEEKEKQIAAESEHIDSLKKEIENFNQNNIDWVKIREVGELDYSKTFLRDTKSKKKEVA